MRLTSFTDYGLWMLMWIASDPNLTFSTADLAQEFNLSRNHLSKIMQRVSQAGIVQTKRGGGDGAIMAIAPSELRRGTIVRLLEEDHSLVECFAEGPNSFTLNGRCSLKTRLRAAEISFLKELDKAILAYIVLAKC